MLRMVPLPFQGRIWSLVIVARIRRRQVEAVAAAVEILAVLRRQIGTADADAHADRAAHIIGLALLDLEPEVVAGLAWDIIFVRAGRRHMDEILAGRQPVDDGLALADPAADQGAHHARTVEHDLAHARRRRRHVRPLALLARGADRERGLGGNGDRGEGADQDRPGERLHIVLPFLGSNHCTGASVSSAAIWALAWVPAGTLTSAPAIR